MGTNYYAQPADCPNPCDHCEQQEVHIGKSLRMFQAHEISPWGRIWSWQDWKRALRTPGVRVIDEYGIKHGTENFIREVEAMPSKARRQQYDWLVKHAPHTVSGDDPTDWLDNDGFSFCRQEFT